VPEGKSFRAAGEAHLADLLEAAGPDKMAALGLNNGTRDLEIEGMTFFRGALYLGLKSPLDAQGNALIWKLNDPKALIAKGSVDAGGLSLFARARLEAEVDGRAVAGGVSELLFLPNGALVIASTSSKEEGSSESGKLWHVASPAPGTLSPHLIKTFPGLKPEGICLSPKPGKLAVVFDTQSAVPSFVELPWPE
jgi:hypothetical protein